MLHLYIVTTGKLISSASIIDNIPEGMAVKESDKKGTWNTETLDFDLVVVERILSRDDFLDLFTDSELTGIVTASKTDPNITIFLDVLNFKGRVRIANETTVNGVTYMETSGLLSEGRAEGILNG